MELIMAPVRRLQAFFWRMVRLGFRLLLYVVALGFIAFVAVMFLGHQGYLDWIVEAVVKSFVPM